MYKIIFLFIIIIPWKICLSQDDTSSYKYWMNAGVWFNGFSDGSVDFSYNFGIQKRFYHVSYLRKGGGSLSGAWSIGSNGYLYNTINLGTGVRHFKRYYLVAAFIGPSIIWGEKDYKGDSRTYFTGGVALDAQFFIIPFEGLGFGLELFGNLNFEKSFYSLQFSIHISNSN